MMKIRILLFASLREKIGQSSFEFEAEDGITVWELRQQLLRAYPVMAEILPNALAAVNQQFTFDPEVIPPDADVAFFPPVSGGSQGHTVLKVTQEALNQDELVAQITFPSTGAVCLFTGIVRGETERGLPHQTIQLEYEAYVPMAEAKMAQVANEIRKRWPTIEGVVIVQRIGLLKSGTPTVVIACSAAHRDTGVFEAARYGIDRLKEIVPIWKKEIGPDGEEWIDGTYHVKPGD